MVFLKPASLIASLIVIASITLCNGTTHCQGTECTLEDLEADSNEQLLQALNATIRSILQSALKIHITHEYQQHGGCAAPKANAEPQIDPRDCADHHANWTTSTTHQSSSEPQTQYPRDCTEIFEQGNISSGYYTIQPRKPQGLYPGINAEDREVNVYCDMDTDGGGWTVFQRRLNGVVDFYREWEDYKHGFGYLKGDYWLGLENLHKLTAMESNELRVELEDFDNNQAHAHYGRFHVKDEGNLYKLFIGEYHGTARDDMGELNNQPFTTKDQDHDALSGGNCAVSRKGAWWYKSCGYTNLNGLYLGPSRSTNTGIRWYHWKGSDEVMKAAEMKIRRTR